MNPVQLIGNAILVAGAIPSVLFVVFYARARWEDTQIGRQTMALSLVIMGVLVLSVFRVFFGDSPVYASVRLAVFALIVPTLWWRLYLLLKTQREGYTRGRTTHPEKEDA
jgi:branched-subunit amino acid transport protein AzlD